MRILLTSLFIYSIVFSQLPISREAKLVEVVSSSEVMIEAAGIYSGKGKRAKHKKKDVTKNGTSKAVVDAKRSAIYFLLFSGTDPLIRNEKDKEKFSSFESSFFQEDKMINYITYEDITIKKKVKIKDGTALKVVKRFKVDKEKITKDLERFGVIISLDTLVESMGNPFIMVLPSVPNGENPIETLSSNKIYRHAAAVVESYLTALQYDVLVPAQQAAMETLNQAQMGIGDREEDYAYQLALSTGSDIYIEFSGTEENAGYGTKKYSINIRAFETTTARLLGSETGYSQGRKGELMVSVEEAMNDAIDKILSRIKSYWVKDINQGVQYKLVFDISTDFDEDEVEEIQFALMDAIEDLSKKSKENIITNQTMDYLIWCDSDKFNKSSKVYRFLKKYFKKEGTNGILRKVNVNRKMILLKVDYE
jgi:hypothetical protein|tara:strand:+ start:1440 stop:2705 length:1266 start_codon:yes stop_codon:yes gene_type:complete